MELSIRTSFSRPSVSSLSLAFPDIVLILPTPVIETLLQLVVRNVISLPHEREARTRRGLPKIMQVREYIQAKGPGIAGRARDALADPELANRPVMQHVPATGQPILGGNMAIPDEDGRQPRDRIIMVRDAPLAAGLAGHPAGELVVADPRRPVGVHVDGVAVIPSEMRRRENGPSRRRGTRDSARGPS